MQELLDRNYAVRAQEIGSKQIRTAKQLTDALTDIIPTDALFETEFAEARVSQVHLARYYLRALELKEQGNDEPEWVPMDDEHIVNLEHILPENPQQSWPNINDETAAAYYKRIGNMVILQARKNSVIGNAAFHDKRQTFSDSNFLLTAEVANYPTWGINEISDRQRRLAQLAVRTWPVQA